MLDSNTARAYPRSDAGRDPPTDPTSKRGVPWSPRPRLKKQVEKEDLRLGTWNVGSMTGRGREVADVMDRRKVAILCVQETRWTGNSARDIGGNCKIIYSGGKTKRNGVGVVLRGEWRDRVMDVKRVNDRLIRVTVLLRDHPLHIISAYAPQVGCSDEDKEDFRSELEECIREVPQSDTVYIGADLNGRVGNRASGYEGVHGDWGYGERNEDGERLLEMAESLDLIFTNTLWKKKVEHLVTYNSGGNKSQIDYILVRKSDKASVRDSKVIPGEACVTQHNLLVIDVKWKKPNKRRPRRKQKLKIWDLKQDKLEKFREQVRQRSDVNNNTNHTTVNEVWRSMKDSLVKAAEDTVGRTKGSGMGPKKEDAWWWKESLKAVLKRKKEAFKEWKTTGSDEAKERYKGINREAKVVVREAKEEATRELYDSLSTKEGEKSIYRIAKSRHRTRQDLGQIGVVKDVNGNILQEEAKIKARWREYFQQLLNVENKRERLENLQPTEGPVKQIEKEEVTEALRKMKCGKAAGPSEVSIDLLKALGEEGEAWLLELLQKVLTEGRMPDDWQKSSIFTLYKNKGDILDCGNYRGIKLTEHVLKVLERILDNRLRNLVTISQKQFGFMKGRGTVDAIFIVRQIQEKSLEGNRNLYYGFVDLEKAYDRVPREVVYWCLRKRGVPERLINLVKEMYRGARTVVSTLFGDTEEFTIDVGLHQGSALSPFLFLVVLDVLTEMMDNDFWDLLYADDLVIMAESENELQQRLVAWQECLERGGLKVNATKTETMVSSKSGDEAIHIKDTAGNLLTQVDTFKYLGATIVQTGGTEGDVRMRIKAGWSKWKEVSGVICDKKIPVCLKCKIYTTVIRPVLLYGAETWALRRKEENQLERTEMRMLRWIQGISLKDRIRNEDIRKSAGVTSIILKAKQEKLRWFGHVLRREEDNPVKKAWREPIKGKRSRGRQRIRWRDGVERDMRELNLTEGDAQDRVLWRQRIQVADPRRDKAKK